jgi:DNA-binding MarR family transcriptional regulator
MDELAGSIDAIARDCIAVRMRLLNRVVTNLYDDALRPLGMKVSQLNILVATAKLGLARPARVCEILQLDASTLSRNVERMRTHGWLEVVPEADARTQPFRLTSRGEAAARGGHPGLAESPASSRGGAGRSRGRAAP